MDTKLCVLNLKWKFVFALDFNLPNLSWHNRHKDAWILLNTQVEPIWHQISGKNVHKLEGNMQREKEVLTMIEIL